LRASRRLSETSSAWNSELPPPSVKKMPPNPAYGLRADTRPGAGAG